MKTSNEEGEEGTVRGPQYWGPWASPRYYGPPPDVIYPGEPFDPYYPVTQRPADDISWLERRLEDLEDEKVDIERAMEDVKKEIERRKRDRREQQDAQ